MISFSDATYDPHTNTLLALKNVTVQRGDFVLCVDVTISLQQGDICHLVGANGAGKTTLMMQLAGLLPIHQGDVYYNGQKQLPIAPVYVSHQLGINSHLTVAQNLIFLLNLYNVTATKEDIHDALSWVGLGGFEAISSQQLSAGQTRRVTLARLYLMMPRHAPIWLLDEPFTALDIDMVVRLQQRMQAFAQAGGTILMTSHQPVTVATSQLNLTEYLPNEDELKEGVQDGCW